MFTGGDKGPVEREGMAAEARPQEAGTHTAERLALTRGQPGGTQVKVRGLEGIGRPQGVVTFLHP